MQLIISVDRKHVYVSVVLVMILFGTLVVSGTGYTSGQAAHATLFTDTLRARSGALVSVLDSISTTTASGQNFLTVTAPGSANAGVQFSNGIEVNNFVFTRGTDGTLLFQTANSDRIIVTRAGAATIGGSLSVGSLFGAGLTSCSGATQKLLYNTVAGMFSCSTDNPGSGGCVQRVGAIGSPRSTVSCLAGEKLVGGGCTGLRESNKACPTLDGVNCIASTTTTANTWLCDWGGTSGGFVGSLAMCCS